jgi:Protein of unknown function (DUF3618)
MDESANSIERHIDEERAQLGATVDALEAKAARAMDWKAHFRDYPGTGMVLAFGAGALAAAAFGGDDDGYSDGEYSGRRRRREGRSRSRVRSAMSGLEAAVMGILANEARRYVRERFGSDSPTAPATSSYDAHDHAHEAYDGSGEQFSERRQDRRFDDMPEAAI